MTKQIIDLEPKNLWKNFQSICNIPHPSKKEEKLAKFIKEFGEGLGLETKVDEVGNILICKPATPGLENRKVAIMQAHIDMVPQKNNDTVHDFEKDPIKAYIDGEWVTAEGTTLGADNGIGCAAMMAILEDNTLTHGPVEALFTIDEETGMTGAFGLKPGFMKGEILLNLDSEDEGELYVGCAGGIDANVEFDYATEVTPAGSKACKLVVNGLKGGHSGLDINLGRGNANKLLVRFMEAAQSELGLRIASMNMGGLRNAIPREAEAVAVIPEANVPAFVEKVAAYKAIFQSELKDTEPGLDFTFTEVEVPSEVIELDAQTRILKSIYACLNGVIRMSAAMEGIVETSTNLASVNTDGKKCYVKCLLRSSVDTAKKDLSKAIESTFTLAGATVEFSGEYSGWNPNMNSPILTTMKDTYNNLYGKVPEIKVIHAGLECGIIAGNYPDLDMISFGPTMCFPHSPDEKVNIETVGKFWEFLKATLENIPQN